MYRISRSVCSGLIVAASLLSSTGAAHAQEASAPRVLTVDQARDVFSQAGYQVDPALDWNWTSPPVTSLQVHDANTGRVIMVFVYPSSAAAQAAFLDASAAANDGGAPHLIAGYGRSVWDGNVAIVQTTQSDSERAYQAQIDRENGLSAVASASGDAAPAEVSVDADFRLALRDGLANL